MKPFFQWLLNIAMNIAPKIPAAPRGVKNPRATESPPPSSPRITKPTHSHTGLYRCFSNPCINLTSPGPANQPKSFCVPCTASVSPTTRRRMRRPLLIVTAMNHVPFNRVDMNRKKQLARYSRASSFLLLLLDELALDEDLDLLADDQLAIEHHVEHQAEVLAVDPTLGAVANAVAHHGIIEFA